MHQKWLSVDEQREIWKRWNKTSVDGNRTSQFTDSVSFKRRISYSISLKTLLFIVSKAKYRVRVTVKEHSPSKAAKTKKKWRLLRYKATSQNNIQNKHLDLSLLYCRLTIWLDSRKDVK